MKHIKGNTKIVIIPAFVVCAVLFAGWVVIKLCGACCCKRIADQYPVGIVRNESFERPVTSSHIAYAPRNDDNSVSCGDYYELYYWDNKSWTSLGVEKACDEKIVFNNVPKGALLWLKDITKGVEERPFVYSNGVQVWY